MSRLNWIKALAATSCAAALCVAAFAAEGLPQSSKILYKDVPSYLDICRAPAKFATKDESKLKFKIIFKNKTENLPAKYEDSFAKSYALIVPEGDVPDSFTKIPIIFSNARGKVRDDITNLELSKPVILYATLRFKMYKDPKKKDSEPEKLYVLMVDDLETPDTAIVIDNAKDSDFAPAKSKRVDIQYDKYLGKKVAIPFRFKDIDNKIPNEIVKVADISSETHFIIQTQEVFHTSIIAERANERCVEPLIDAQPGDAIVVNGVLTKAEDPTSQKHIPIYFFVVHSVVNGQAANASATAAAATAKAPAPSAQPASAPAPEAAPAPAAAPQAAPETAKPAAPALPPEWSEELPPLPPSKSAPSTKPAAPAASSSGTPAKPAAEAAKAPAAGSVSPLDDWKSILQEQAK